MGRLWIEEQKGIKKCIKRYEEDFKKMFDIMHGQLSLGITEKLKAKEDWTGTEEQANTLKLLDPTKYVEEVQMRFKVMKAAGIRIVSKELISYSMKRVFPTKKYGNYSGMSDADKQSIIEAAKQILLSVQIIKGSNQKNHRNLQGTLKEEYCLKKDAYPVNISEALDMLLRFKTVKSNNAKQTSNNASNSNNSKAARTEGNSKQGSEKTFEGTAFVTNGEASKGVVKEAHQLLMKRIAEGETFGDELCFIEEDEAVPDDGVPMLVAGQANWGSDSESSTTEKPRSENRRSEDDRSEKPRSEDDASRTMDTISPDTEILLAQNHGKLDPNLLLLDSQASCNVISNKALLRNIRPHPDNGQIVIHCNAGSVATTIITFLLNPVC
eukprot:jgi/Psemu1/23341/gm1.23341_g